MLNIKALYRILISMHQAFILNQPIALSNSARLTSFASPGVT